MDDQIAEVHQQPARFRDALDAMRQDARFLFGFQTNAFSQGAELPVVFPVAKQEIVGEDSLLAQVEQDDVVPLFIQDGIHQNVCKF